MADGWGGSASRPSASRLLGRHAGSGRWTRSPVRASDRVTVPPRGGPAPGRSPGPARRRRVAGPGVVEPGEPVEDPLPVRRRDARPVVGHRDQVVRRPPSVAPRRPRAPTSPCACRTALSTRLASTRPARPASPTVHSGPAGGVDRHRRRRVAARPRRSAARPARPAPAAPGRRRRRPRGPAAAGRRPAGPAARRRRAGRRPPPASPPVGRAAGPPPAGSACWPAGCAARARRRRRTPAAGPGPPPAGPACR